MVGVNILDHHERDRQLEEPRVQDITHLAVLFVKEGQHCVDLLDLPSTHAQLILVAVIGEVDAIDRVMSFSEL